MAYCIKKSIPLFLILGVLLIMTGLSSGEGMTRFEEETLSHINQYRAEHGLAQLALDEKLQAIAKEHSAWMYRHRTFGHQNFDARFRKAGRRVCGENVGWNSRTPYEQFTGWRDSAGHKKNILNGMLKYAGVSKAGAYVTFFACN